MSRSGFGRAAALCSSLAGALLGATAALAEKPSFASIETARDFQIQNVCIDESRKVLERVSPIDGDRRCIAQRDLMPAENLPYHKHDHPATAGRAAAPRGYQRHDSIPVDTAQFGMMVEHSFDFGFAEGRQFGVFDAGRGDGGDITFLSPQTVSFAATEDGGAGFQLFVGPDCRDRIGAAALAGSWIIALLDPSRHLAGETVARLSDLDPARQSNCPTRLNAAFTRWYIEAVAYRAGEGQGTPVTLTTLISEHYGSEHPGSADHVERFYFTRELGSTRWERWQSLSRSRGFSADQVAKAASDLALSGRCSKANVPAAGAPSVMVDCREWTLIVPAEDRSGDRPGFFIDAIRLRHLGGDLFIAPGDFGTESRGMNSVR
jgi:hypothetical protein